MCIYTNEEVIITELIDKWYGLEETAEYLGLTKDTNRNSNKKSHIPAH